MIKAVLFDAGGVLHESNNAVAADVQQTLGLTTDQITEIWADQIYRLGSGQLDEMGLWREVQQQHGIRLVDPGEQLLSRAFARELRLNTRVLAIAQRLGQAGLEVAVLSDTNALHAQVIEDAGGYQPFGHRFLSHQMGLRKPDSRIYQAALGVLGVQPAESIFIDDAPANVTAAQQLGMYGITFENTEQFVAELAALLPGIELEK